MRKIFVLMLLALCAAGCGKSENKLRIAVSMPSATHGWTGGVVWHAQQAKQKIEAANPDVEIIIAASENAASQVSAIESLTMQSPDALVVMGQEPEPLLDACRRAKQSGAALVVVSNPLPEAIHDLFINGDNGSFGAAAGEAMGKALDGKGKILVMEGVPCPINTERVQSFRKVLQEKYPQITILDSLPADWNTEKGLRLMENFLQKYPAIDGVWAGDDDVLTGAWKAYQESGRKEIRAFVGGGGAKTIVKMVQDNNTPVKATVTYPPQMIAIGMEKALEALRNNRTFAEKEIVVPSEIVTPENAAKYYFPDSLY